MKIINKKIVVVIIGALFVSFIGATFNVFADIQKQSMHVSPPNHRMILIPGETYEDSFIVSNANDSTRALKYDLVIGAFSEKSSDDSKDDYGTVDYITTSSYNQIMDWITLDRKGGTVEPNQKDIVNFSIAVPKNAPAGGQYATIIVRDVTDRDAESNGNVAVQSTMQFASIIYAEVAGETKQEGKIIDNNIPSFNLNTPFEASSMVENTGNVHTKAEYTMEIWPLFSDEEAYTNVDNPVTTDVLPETKRYYAQTWDDAPMVGIFRVKQTVKIFGDTSIVEKTVIICPLWLVFIIVVAVVLIAIWIVTKVRSRKARD